MLQIGLIGLGAGIAAALLFASVASGSLFSVFLFYLAPLPILIAALGWSQWAGLVGALVASAGLAAIFGSFFFLAFLTGVGLPAWWLGYLALLARPTTDGTTESLEWYPVGKLVFWAAILGALVVAVGILNLGTDIETVQSTLRRGFERVLRASTHTPTDGRLELPGMQDPGRFLDFLVTVIPSAAAVLSTMTGVLNLWLAGRIVKISGRLRRPWPDLSAMTLPPLASAVLAAAVLGTFLGGLIAIMSAALTASLLMAFAVLGFAVVHSLTHGMGSRNFVLAGVYSAVVVFGWPVLAVALLGLADSAFNIRARVGARRGPPSIPT